MNEAIDNLKQQLIGMQACSRINRIHDWKSLASSILSPQGIEFIMLRKDHSQLLLDLFRSCGDKIDAYGIIVDGGAISIEGRKSSAFVGNTSAFVRCHGAKLSNILVAYGATLTVDARNYAVVKIHNMGGEVTVIADKTSKVFQ